MVEMVADWYGSSTPVGFSRREPMNVESGNPANLLTSWAKRTASVSVRKKAGSRGCVISSGFGLGSP